MREARTGMAELEFEAPLAQIEDADDCLTQDYPQKTINGNDIRLNNINHLKSEIAKIQTDSNKINDNDGQKVVKCKQDNVQTGDGDNFTETFSGSLEDLVNTFDEKITKCFGNYEESVEKLAPVQVRSQEEIMNECQLEAYDRNFNFENPADDCPETQVDLPDERFFRDVNSNTIINAY